MMKKIRKWFSSPAAAGVMLVLAVGLLLFSSINVTRAALTRRSAIYTAEASMKDIGLTLKENGEDVAKRDYDSKKTDGTWIGTVSGTLLEDLTEEDEQFVLNVPYEEKLCVANSGTIDEFVRVSIRRYWLDKDNNKLTELSPDLISLSYDGVSLDEGSSFGAWVKDDEATTAERIVLYYTKALVPEEESDLFADELSVSNEVAKKMKQIEDGNTITTVYEYDGAQFCLEVTADAVQTHNAEEAILSAWGREVTATETTLTLK